MVPKLFKKRYKEKCTHNTFSMPKALTEIGADDRTKGQTKAVILVPKPHIHSALKYLILLLQHPLKLNYFRC